MSEVAESGVKLYCGIPKEQVRQWWKAKADILYPDLLTPEQLYAVQRYRLKQKERKGVITEQERKEQERLKAQRKVMLDPAAEYIGTKSDNGNIVYDGSEDFDIWQLMKDAEDPSTGVLRDLTVDDRDFATAKNYYDYSFNLIGTDAHPPWSRQLWIGAMAFGEVCPVCSNKKFLKIDNIDKSMPAYDLAGDMVFLEWGKCPKCKRGKSELIKNHGLKNYMAMVSCLGQRSGKSASAAHYQSYITHRYLKFPNLASLSNLMQASTELTCTFVSLSLAKALGVLWTPYKKIFEQSTWWKSYFAFLDDTGNRLGRKLYRTSTMYQAFYWKNMRFYPSGPKSNILRGDTRIGALLDEIGLFPLTDPNAEEDDSTSERANADEAYKSLMNSLTTVQTIGDNLLEQGYDFVPPALMIATSSPVSLRDKVMRLLAESRTPEGSQVILGNQLATWEMNPGISRDSRIIKAAFAANREKAMRDYGAQPPAIASPFILKKYVENDIFVSKLNTHRISVRMDQPDEIYAHVERVGTVRWPSVVAIDAGAVNNSFTLTADHYDFDTGQTVTSTVLELIPIDGRAINFNLVYKHMILPVLKDVNAVMLLADQWQSLDILHRAKEDMGLNPLGKPRCLTKQWTPRRKNFETARAMIQAKNVVCPAIREDLKQRVLDFQIENYRTELNGEPAAHLMLQMMTVKDVGEKLCPTKGDGFTDDIFRSWVLSTAILHEEKVMERLKEAKDWRYDGSGGRKMPMPAYAGRSGQHIRRGY